VTDQILDDSDTTDFRFKAVRQRHINIKFLVSAALPEHTFGFARVSAEQEAC